MSRVSATPDDPLSVPAPDLDPDALLASVESLWGLSGDLTPLHGERDSNFRLESGPLRHLLKVHNPADPEEVVDLQCSALHHLRIGGAGAARARPRADPRRTAVGAADRARRSSLVRLGADLAGGPTPRGRRARRGPPPRVGAHERPPRAGTARLRPPRRDPSPDLGHQAAARSCGPGSPRSLPTDARRSRRCSTASTSTSRRCCHGCAPRWCTTTWRRPTCCSTTGWASRASPTSAT